MTPEAISAVISGIGVLLSITGSAFIAGLRWGSVRVRIDIMERAISTMATHEQLAAVRQDVAEIKGMFRMTLRDGTGHE